MGTNPVPEMITRAQADNLMLGLLALGFLIMAVAATVAKNRDGAPGRAALLYGGPPVLLGLLWHLYNFITDKLGLDSVANLAVNVLLFVGIGVAVGLTLRRVSANKQDEATPAP